MSGYVRVFAALTVVASVLLAAFHGPVLVAPAHAGPADSGGSMRLGLHVPWAVGGPRIEADGTRSVHPGEWPTVPVRAVRLWDTRTAWLHLEPAQDLWRFEHLDAHVRKARAHGVTHITLVLWGTPVWAARDHDSADAPWLGPGSAAPPRHLDDWLDYVTTVASRYRGQIDAYQIGNEPNHRMFWRGTDTELVTMVSTAAEAIKGIDPAATVIAPPILLTGNHQLRMASRTWKALANATDAIDAWSMHWYPAPGTPMTQFTAAIARAPKPRWVTEVGLPFGGRTPRQQAADIGQLRTIAARVGVDYLAWYAWTDLGPPGLIDLRRTELLRQALAD